MKEQELPKKMVWSVFKIHSDYNAVVEPSGFTEK